MLQMEIDKIKGRGISMYIRNFVIIALIFISSLLVSSILKAENIHSCINEASNRNKAGASTNCAPVILSNDTAFEIIKTFNVVKVGYDRYIFMKKEKLSKIDYKRKWELIALMVSAVQSLYGENADCYLASLPETEADKTALMLDSYPESRIAACAKYVWPDLKSHPERKWPPNHHERLYKLIVY